MSLQKAYQISHLKQDHRMDHCRYKGFDGDQISVSLAATAWNARKWMKQRTSGAASN
jgi:hypothetical protein